jgi:hypothetical protein
VTPRIGGHGRAFALAAALACALIVVAPSRADAPVDVRLARSTFAIGESTTLEIAVTGNVSGDPEFQVPNGLEVLSSGRMQNTSWINGRFSSQIVFRYEIGGNQAGQFSIGPFHVHVAGQLVTSPAVDVNVTAAQTRLGPGGRGQGAATLLADLEPREPYVGQPVILRVRLILRQQLAEDPQYIPPSTPGFWSEMASRPESYYAAEGNQRVLVTESRTRLYPLTTGDQKIGEAMAHLALLEPGSDDPLMWIGGRVPRREFVVKSEPVAAHVRALPRGAPTGFDGAVGVLTASWSCDRDRTARDVPVTIRLDVRGIGNLPLIHAPRLETPDFEVFAGVPQDSAGPAGSATAGRRSFQWTLLPRRLGHLEISAPTFAWFDPSVPAYRALPTTPLPLDVDPPLRSENDARAEFPAVFSSHPLDPGATPAMPWAYALAGGAVGAAIVLWRRAARPPADAAERAHQRERLRVVGLARGLDFWRAADEATQWLESRGRSARALRDVISAARYSGSNADPEKIRRSLIEQLGAEMPREIPRVPLRAAAVSLALAGIALVVIFLPRPGDRTDWQQNARSAESAARAGELTRARSAWLALWNAGDREAGLAARMAWLEIQGGAVGPSAAWVLAGQGDDPRDPGLTWVEERVREAGGLVGATTTRLPVRRLEWAVVALIFALAAGALWPRRLVSVSCLAVAVAAACVFPLQGFWLRHSDRAVVRERIAFEQSLDLETGQVVRILERRQDRLRVSAGRGVEGWIPASAVYSIEELK